MSSVIVDRIGAVLVEKYISKTASSEENGLVNSIDPSDLFEIILAIKEERREENGVDIGRKFPNQ